MQARSMQPLGSRGSSLQCSPMVAEAVAILRGIQLAGLRHCLVNPVPLDRVGSLVNDRNRHESEIGLVIDEIGHLMQRLADYKDELSSNKAEDKTPQLCFLSKVMSEGTTHKSATDKSVGKRISMFSS
ncbi:hypothetical protein QYF36_008120 [Acer negundo]|nr:hypothetical protein QYF36_008120 [Acer negundo]